MEKVYFCDNIGTTSQGNFLLLKIVGIRTREESLCGLLSTIPISWRGRKITAF